MSKCPVCGVVSREADDPIPRADQLSRTACHEEVLRRERAAASAEMERVTRERDEAVALLERAELVLAIVVDECSQDDPCEACLAAVTERAYLCRQALGEWANRRTRKDEP